MNAVECFGKSLEIDPKARELGVKAAVICFSVIERPPVDESYRNRFKIAAEQVRIRVTGSVKSLDRLKDHPVVRAYRDFYWRIGVDPTKTRPAGEALSRRLLSGRGVDPIEPVVDAGNLASAESLISIGLYDVSKLPGDMRLTLSSGRERFYPIGGGEETLWPSLPILLSGPVVVHLYPHRDSRLTSIDTETRDVLGISAGVPGVDDSLLLDSLRRTLYYMEVLGVQFKIIKGPIII